MSLELGQFYNRDWMGKPPHMASQDLPIWERFRDKYKNDFVGWYFDAACGTPAEVPPGTEPNLAKMWTRITSKRIDVVGVKTNEYWIIEIRPDAAAGALGTIMTYINCVSVDPPDDRSLVAALVSDRFDPDIVDLAKSFNINLIQV